MTDRERHRSIDRMMAKFNAAVANTRIYFQDHPEVARHLDALHTEIADLLKFDSHLTLIVVDDELVEGGTPIRSERGVLKQMTALLKEQGIEHLTFRRGITKQELKGLVTTLAGKSETGLKSGDHLKLGKIAIEDGDTSRERKASPSPGIALEISRKFLEVKKVYLNIKQKKGINALVLGDIVNAFTDVFERGHNPIHLLAMIRNTDEYTFTHVVNVCILTMSQAESLGFSGRFLFEIGIASMLHDVGKLFIPDEILKKPGALTPDERKIIDGHVVKGALYVMGLKDIPKLAVLGALEHHMKHDGGGYPRIKGGYTPNIASQMIAIADAYDAMRSRRTYQEPKPRDVIIRILTEEKGKSFDPFLVDNFIGLMAD